MLLNKVGHEIMQGMSRKQIEDRGGYNELVQAVERKIPAPHKKAYGFSIQHRAGLREKK